tara:strand:+ start:1803 stop:2171 length:369 start_codon:yes stop_codon:yes gene_type:complete
MSRWKEILKGHCGTQAEKTESEERQEFEKFPDLSGDGKITRKDILIGRGVIDKDGEKKAEKSIEQIKKEILQEVMKEGGALGMKNLKSIASQDLLDKAISQLMQEGKLFEHKHGDFYTHTPK